MTNCAFHVWSMQMFLYLTQTDPATGQPRLLSQYTLEELFAPKSATAAAVRSIQPLKLSPKLAKQDAPDLAEINQAGSQGILVDQQGEAVYYTQFVNQTFYDFVRGKFFTNGAGGTFDPALLAAATGFKDFFIPGSMELKSSWMIVEDGAGDGFFTTPAEVHLLVDQGGEIVVDPNNTREVTAALVGLHIAGVVEEHPEFIWATFEHKNNAPNLPNGMMPGSGDPVSDRDWTFYAANTPAKDSNQNPAGNLVLDPATQKLKPVVNVFRRFADGTINGGAGAETNRANIAAINDFVEKNYAPAGTEWPNYEEIGAIWMLSNTLQPGQFPITELRGSTMLSNATMETYTQNDQQCFSCHNTLLVEETLKNNAKATLPATNFNVSHILVGEFFRAMSQKAGLKVRALR